MYLIRGLSISSSFTEKMLSVVLRNVSTNRYIQFDYIVVPGTNKNKIIKFLAQELHCNRKDIFISSHVSFERVGIQG